MQEPRHRLRVRTVMKNLEKFWNFKIKFPGPGKVMEKSILPESFGKVMEINLMFRRLSDLMCPVTKC